MNKKILFGKEARDKVRAGVNKIADAVSVTLGAMGRNVLIAKSLVIDYGVRALPVHVTKDGVSVAREVHLDDPVENVGANIVREASEKTMLMAGDGTTSTVVMARALIEKGLSLVDAGANPMEVKKGIEKATIFVVEELKKLAVAVGETDVEKIRQVATISANNDMEIGNLIADAFKKIGRDGIINIEESTNAQTEIKLSDGFEFLRGYISQWFITNTAKMISELDNPYILLYEKPILQMKLISNIAQQVSAEGRPLLIICEDMEGDALAFLITNNQQGNFRSCVVQCPNFGESRRDIMEDIAAVTGGTYLSDSKGVAIEKATKAHLGQAKKVIISKDKTSIIGAMGDKKIVDSKISDLKIALAHAQTDDEREIYEKRIAKLTESAATIFVGAATETEMKEKKDRVDDAVRATKAAIAEGYVPGGGTAFIRATKPGMMDDVDGDQLKGVAIVIESIHEPLRQLCRNAGVDDNEILKKLQEVSGNIGYNVRENKIEDLVEAGVIDPVKVLRCALINAASVSAMVITSEAMIVDTLN